MKYWVLILTPALLLTTPPEIQAHDLLTVSGNAKAHQHVYRRQQYGEPLQQGHLYQNPDGNSMVIWGSTTQSNYGKPDGRRDGPIIDDQPSRPGERIAGSKKFGAEVRGYGKSRRGYGSR